MAFNVSCRRRAGVHRGRPVADPQACGRSHQDGSAGCGQSGAAASRGRADGGVGSRRRARGGALPGAGASGCGTCVAPGTPTALGVSVASGLPLRSAGLDQAASPMAHGLRFEQAVHHIVLEDYVQAVEAAEARRDRPTAQIEAMCRIGRWPRSWRRCRRCAAWHWSMRRR
jgi:hypothetical protein